MKILSCIATLFLVTSINAQVNEVRWCGQQAAQEKLFNSRQGAREEAELAKQILEEHTLNYSESDRSGDEPVYVVPVVFHVIHMNGPENISDAQIRNAVDIMTRDFRKQNTDIVNVVPQFQSIAADCQIEFRLATKDLNNNCHSGINRVQSSLTYDGWNDGLKGLSYWPRNKYLNIWVCANLEGAAGYSIFPQHVSSSWEAGEDGIVILSNYVGNIGTGSEARSRALTHEIGHWLNLSHLWGDSNYPGDESNCGMTDWVSDTPQTIGHISCNLAASTCDGSLDNVQNYMEYSYCSNMFTAGQRARMRAALTSPVASRNQLITQSNGIATGVINPPLCVAAFSSSIKTVCEGSTITFQDESYSAITNWNWDFGDGTTLQGSNPLIHKNPAHQYLTSGTYTVTLTVNQGASSLTKTMENYIHVFPASMISQNLYEGFEGQWPNSNFFVDNQNQDLTFEITPTASFSGSKSLKLRNHGNTVLGNTDILYTATFDLSNAANAELSYRWAYAGKTTPSADKLVISFSGDCGSTWAVRRTREGVSGLSTAASINTQFTPTTSSQWGGESLTIGAASWLTNNFQARFEFIGQGGNNLYLDDINITANFPVGVSELKPTSLFGVYPNPSSSNMTLDFMLQSSEEVSIMLYNTTGQLCENLYKGHLPAGKHLFSIEKQPAGLYNMILTQGKNVSVQKIIFE